MALIANSVDDYFDQMSILTERLASLAERQAALFDANRFDDASALNEEASRLAATYLMESQKLAKNGAVVAKASPNFRDKLIAQTARFRDAMAAHERVLARKQYIAEGLVRSIAEEAARTNPQKVTYGPGAQMAVSGGAIALDKRA